MKITDNQLIRMLLLTSWAFQQTQARPPVYNASSVSERPAPGIDDFYEPPLGPPRQGVKDSPLFLTMLGAFSFFFTFIMCAYAGKACTRTCDTLRRRREQGRPLTPAYNNANNRPLPDIELQFLPSTQEERVEAEQPLSGEIVEDEVVGRLLGNGM